MPHSPRSGPSVSITLSTIAIALGAVAASCAQPKVDGPVESPPAAVTPAAATPAATGTSSGVGVVKASGGWVSAQRERTLR